MAGARASERETRELLNKVMWAAAKWTREPLRSWAARRGGDWREGTEECLIRAERAWESGREAEIRETGEALVKLRRALRTLADVERQLHGRAGTSRRCVERWADWVAAYGTGRGGARVAAPPPPPG